MVRHSGWHAGRGIRQPERLISTSGGTTRVTLKWPCADAILGQSGATRPGTFVNPIGVG